MLEAVWFLEVVTIMADEKPKILGATAFKPVERHGWEAVRYMIYNPDTGEYFTRTPKSWALITIFYIIYYSCLAAFWAGMLAIFLTTLQDDQPKWQGDNGIIGESPGLGLKPGQTAKNIDSSMIQFNSAAAEDDGDVEGWTSWKNRVVEFLEKYKTEEAGGKVCNPGDEPSVDSFCKFDIATSLGPCGAGNYGYDKGNPCVYLKLNKIYNVRNEPWTDPDTEEGFPEDMPETLKTHIKGQADKQMIWVECHGENPADKEALAGKIKYYPNTQGFPLYYFPYLNQKGYQSPVVAVQFEGVTKNQLVHIECRAWAQKIGYNRRDRIGINHLELHILDNTAAEKINS